MSAALLGIGSYVFMLHAQTLGTTTLFHTYHKNSTYYTIQIQHVFLTASQECGCVVIACT